MAGLQAAANWGAGNLGGLQTACKLSKCELEHNPLNSTNLDRLFGLPSPGNGPPEPLGRKDFRRFGRAPPPRS